MNRQSPEHSAEPCPVCARLASWAHFDSLRNEFNCLHCRKRFARAALAFDPDWMRRHPPSGTWLRETPAGWVAGAKADSLKLFIASLLVGGAGAATFGPALFSRNAPTLAIIALGSVLPVCFLICGLWQMTSICEVERMPDRLILRNGPRLWRTERSIWVDDIRQIYEAHTALRSPKWFIYILADRWFALGKSLTAPRRRWLLSVLLDRIPLASTPSPAPQPASHHPSADSGRSSAGPPR